MSTERTKFVAGKRGVIDVNAFYGSMTVGGGEGGGIPLVVRSRVAPLWQRQQMDVKTRSTLVNRRRDQVAATSSARKVPTSTVGAKKLATRRVATTDVPPKKATATTTINIRRNNDNGDYKWHATGRTLAMNGSTSKRVATKRVARTGRNMEPIVTKWLLMPQSNFRQSSVSSLEDITREAAAEKQTDDQQQQQEMQQQQLNLEAKPKSILVNSKVSKLLLEEQTQAQLKPLLTKRQQQQQQSLLLQADSVESTTFVDNSKLAASSAKPSPNSSSNTNSNWHSKSSSNSTYQTALGICCSSSGSWGHEQPILPQTAGNRGVKITATVIKIMPELPATKATTNLPVSEEVTAAKAAPTAVTTLPVVTPPTVAASKPQKRILYKAKQTQQTERLPVKPIKLKQPPAIATAATRAKATAAGAAPPTVAAKIVRVAQHKVPSTIEDGIDVSYQYFVSTPLARGKKPLPIRYLYRPMMRRLNNTTTAATRHGRRSKKGTSKTGTEPTEADQPPVLSQSSTDVESDSGSEQQQQQEEEQQQQQQAQPQEFKKKLLVEDEQDFKPPPLLVDPKYLPFVKQLKNHPMPKETRAQQQYNIQLQRQHQQQKRQQLEQQHWQQQNLRHQHLEQQQLQQQYLQQQQLQQEQLRAQQLEQERLEQQQFSILQQMKLQLHKQQRVIQEQQQQLLAHEIQQQQQQQQQQQEQNKRPTLLDYQPNVTRLPAVGGANICFHAPIRMCAGNEAATATTTTTATNTETTATTPAFATAAAIPSIAAVETATTAPATASIAAATAAATTAMQSLIAAVRYEDIEIPSCSEKSVSFEMENKCCCSASNISNMSPKSRSDKKKRKSKARGKKKNRK